MARPENANCMSLLVKDHHTTHTAADDDQRTKDPINHRNTLDNCSGEPTHNNNNINISLFLNYIIIMITLASMWLYG